MDKKRYLVSLRQDKAFRLKSQIKQLGLPSGHFSVLLDEHIETLIPIMDMLIEKKKNGEQLTIYEIIGKTSEIAQDKYGKE